MNEVANVAAGSQPFQDKPTMTPVQAAQRLDMTLFALTGGLVLAFLVLLPSLWDALRITLSLKRG